MPVSIERFESTLLAHNPLGDTPDAADSGLRPPGHVPGRRYPVLYALAGFTGTGLSFLNYDFYQPNLPDQLDALISAGDMAPVVVVMVDGMTRLGGNQYIDSPAVGPWARHIVEELVPWAEATLPVLRGRATSRRLRQVVRRLRRADDGAGARRDLRGGRVALRRHLLRLLLRGGLPARHRRAAEGGWRGALARRVARPREAARVDVPGREHRGDERLLQPQSRPRPAASTCPSISRRANCGRTCSPDGNGAIPSNSSRATNTPCAHSRCCTSTAATATSTTCTTATGSCTPA
jgi:hypothetical protein